MLKPLLPGICQINAAFHLSSTQGRRKQGGQGIGSPNLEDLEKKTETDNLLIVPPPRFLDLPLPLVLIAFETIRGVIISLENSKID